MICGGARRLLSAYYVHDSRSFASSVVQRLRSQDGDLIVGHVDGLEAFGFISKL